MPRPACLSTSTAELSPTIDAFLDQIEAVNKEHPIKNLRWMLAHVNQINASQIDRMKKLGMYAAVHPWAVINGGIMHEGFGDGAYDMPPLRTLQESGITWGLGTDGSAANQYFPFTTLSFAVTGKMAGGAKVNRQTISREDALIAHTRKNAYFIFSGEQPGIPYSRENWRTWLCSTATILRFPRTRSRTSSQS